MSRPVVRFDNGERQECVPAVMRLGSVPILAYPTVIWTRLMWCRKHGHNLRPRGEHALDAPLDDRSAAPVLRFCENCGAPWLRSKL